MKPYPKLGLAALLFLGTCASDISPSSGLVLNPHKRHPLPSGAAVFDAGRSSPDVIEFYDSERGGTQIARKFFRTEEEGVYSAYTTRGTSCSRCHKDYEEVKLSPKLYDFIKSLKKQPIK